MTREYRQLLRDQAAYAAMHLSKARLELAKAEPDDEAVATHLTNYAAASRALVVTLPPTNPRVNDEPGAGEVHI